MSRYPRSGPFMDATVLRSAPHSSYHVDPDALSPRYATGHVRSDDYVREPEDRYHTVVRSALDYGTDRRLVGDYTPPGRSIDDLVRKTNQNASLLNGSITINQVSRDSLIQPKIRVDGRYPSGFSTPMCIDAFMALPESQLERLLKEYEIPSQGRYGSSLSRGTDLLASGDSKLLKLAALLEFLGAHQIAQVLRSRLGNVVADPRPLLTGRSRRRRT